MKKLKSLALYGFYNLFNTKNTAKRLALKSRIVYQMTKRPEKTASRVINL